MKNIIGLLTGVAILATSCSDKKPVPEPEKPVIVNPGEAGTLRIVSYNIHHCNPPSKPNEIDINAVVNVISQQAPDLVAFQEVDVNTSRSGPFNQAQEIARKLAMNYYFGKAINYGGGEYGVAILSKYPISESKIHPLPSEAGSTAEARVLATVKVTLPDGKVIRFGSTHLDAQSSANRELQVKEINRLSSLETLPFIIAGDFNAVPGSTPVQLLDQKFQRTCQLCAPTIPATNPVKAIDFIAFMPVQLFNIISHKVISAPYPSDHLPVLAVLQLQTD